MHGRRRLRGAGAVAAGVVVGTGAVMMVLGAAGAGCASTKIAIKERFGYAKREQLVDNVKAARDQQQEAKEQFASALDEFLAVTNMRGNVADLEARYSRLKTAYERSEREAEDVRRRIRDVERVADALFAEWKRELGEYESESLRRASERQLEETRVRYNGLLRAMKDAESKMAPVLAAFKDQVLFLKHNLNARAIASLQGTAAEIQGDVERLIREMEESIAEADAFVREMEAGAGAG